jgi:ubiquinone/menaquinone biosynthesis C-methylase UbiE
MKDDDIKKLYYERKAVTFDETCIRECDEHYEALSVIAMFVSRLEVSSILDVGCGTGRGIGYFLKNFPELDVQGIDASEAQLHQAEIKNGIPPERLHVGSATRLPFPDKSFDVVCEFGVLHHIKDPEQAVKEMLRVARKAVFISDCNRFGQGGLASRRIKGWLANLRMWPLANWIKTRGKGYYFSEEDGLAYSYSVYDTLDIVRAWGERVFLYPIESSREGGLHPYTTTGQLLVGAIRNHADLFVGNQNINA